MYAIPASLWEWDDINFARRYSPLRHRESQLRIRPGFPCSSRSPVSHTRCLHDEHRALVAVNFVFSCLLGVILYFLFQEIFENRVARLFLVPCSPASPRPCGFTAAIARSDGPTLGLGLITLVLGSEREGEATSRSCAGVCSFSGLRWVFASPSFALAGPLLVFVLWQRLRRARVASDSGRSIRDRCLRTGMVCTGHRAYRGATHISERCEFSRQYVWRSDPIFVPEIPLALRFEPFLYSRLGRRVDRSFDLRSLGDWAGCSLFIIEKDPLI